MIETAIPVIRKEKAYILNDGQYNDSLNLAQNWTLDKAIKYNNEDKISEIEESLAENIMPDLTDLELEDAIFLLENKGLKVKFEGFGTVTSQSIAAGTELKDKKNITITLD